MDQLSFIRGWGGRFVVPIPRSRWPLERDRTEPFGSGGPRPSLARMDAALAGSAPRAHRTIEVLPRGLDEPAHEWRHTWPRAKAMLHP